MDRFTPKQKKELQQIGISFVLFVILMVSEHAGLFPDTLGGTVTELLLYLVPYFIVGHDVVRKCLIGIRNRQLFDESFLMTLATVGAFGCKEFGEAVAVMLFYQVGEFFQSYAVGKSRGSIADLMSMAADFANREAEDGSIEVIDPDDIEVGDILVIKPGEKIPTDGVVIEGSGLVNTSALTGESLPRPVAVGEQVISGCINGDSLLEEASSRKSVTENFITRFARWYTPTVVIAAVILAFLPPLISGSFAAEFGEWVLRACTFLVISCPCALVISVPLAFFGGIGAASRNGVLVKGSNYLELLSELDTVVSDKTGTLTEGRFKVAAVEAAEGYAAEDIVRFAAAAESGSTHPIAAAIIEACDDPIAQSKIKDVKTAAGKGITATAGEDHITVGNRGFLETEGIKIPDIDTEVSGTNCYVAKNGKYIGTIIVADMPKAGVKEAISGMLEAGVKNIVMLTGDSGKVAGAVAKELGISDYRAALLPQDKVSAVEELLDALRKKAGGNDADRKRGRLAFIGDGINDAPVLSVADVGIAMGSLGSDAAIEAADVVIMDDDIAKIPAVMKTARKTLSISRQNIVFALFVKFACLLLGALGIANMWVAVFADVGVAVICILNSMRMLEKQK